MHGLSTSQARERGRRGGWDDDVLGTGLERIEDGLAVVLVQALHEGARAQPQPQTQTHTQRAAAQPSATTTHRRPEITLPHAVHAPTAELALRSTSARARTRTRVSECVVCVVPHRDGAEVDELLQVRHQQRRSCTCATRSAHNPATEKCGNEMRQDGVVLNDNTGSIPSPRLTDSEYAIRERPTHHGKDRTKCPRPTN